MNLTNRTIIVSAIVSLMVSALAASGQTQSTDAQELLLNQIIKREMMGAETHRYKFHLTANEFFQVRVEQEGIDVVLMILDIRGDLLAGMNSPNGTVGPETLSFVVREPASLVLEVKPIDEKAAKGKYAISRASPHRFTIGDQWRLKAEQLFVAGLAEDVTDRKESAISLLSEAHAIWQQLGDSYLAQLTAKRVSFLKGKLAYEAAEILQRKRTAKSLRAAIASFQEAQRCYHESGNQTFEALALNSLGHLHVQLGDYRKALNYHRESLSLINDDMMGKGTTLHNIAVAYHNLGENQKALEYYNRALEVWKTIGNKTREAMTILGTGQIYSDLGESQKAFDYFDQALGISEKARDNVGKAAILNCIGGLHYVLRNYDKALHYYTRALSINKAIHDGDGEAQVRNNIGLVHANLGNNRKALEYYDKALRLQMAIGNKSGQGTTLNNMGLAYRGIGDNQKAVRYYNEAMSILGVVGDKRSEATTLSNLMFVWVALGNRRMAGFYGKQAVNKYQELRRAIGGLKQDTQKSFLGTIQHYYKSLADLLIADGRLLEAEKVLAMLKQEEVFDYLRRDASETDRLQLRADLTTAEAAALKRYNEIAERITALGEEFGSLQELKIKGRKLTHQEAKRYDELSRQIEDANLVFEVFLREVAEEFAMRPNIGKDLEESIGLGFDFGHGVVFLYTLVGEDRYRVVLITPNARTDGKSEIKAAALDEKIEAFRQVVQDPNSDARALGKELYDILIRPIETQLDGAKAETLLWSLDGNLRLLPLAALWDGKQYFGQKYKNVIVTRASLTRLGDQDTANWRALAMGVSKPKVVKDPNGPGNLVFGALPAVPNELLSIVRSKQSPTGILPGQSLIDEEFNELTLKTELVLGYKLVHIASHFSLNPGDSTKSFLLLGDGSTLTVEDIRTKPELQFQNVELLTLSACQTALIGKDTSGQEIEGFGYVAQARGAKAILATLWRVADQSTQILMSRFYRLRRDNPKLTKADALQMAQREMIEGRLLPPTTHQQRITAGKSNRETSGVGYDSKKPYAHPYFWAPFILIGNWK